MLRAASTILLLIAPLASGVSLDRVDGPLKNLSSGTVLKLKAPITIRANDWDEPIDNGQGTLHCQIRAKRAETFDRVLPVDLELPVTDVSVAGFASTSFTANTFTIGVQSHSIESIACAGRKNAPEPRIHDFVAAVRGSIEVRPAPGPVEVQ